MIKVNSIKSALNIKTAQATKSVAKKGAAVATKPAMKNANGAEALAAQNKAMIKMENPNKLKATSSSGAGGGDEWYESLEF